MRHRIGRACVALALTILYILSTASVVRADDPTPVATILTIAPSGPLVVGEKSTIIADLTNAAGERVGAVANEVVYLFVDNVQERRVRTDKAGTASFPILRDLSVGTHSIRVVYNGSRSLLPSSASTELVIEPAEVEIHTVPAVPGIVFSLDGETFVSDENGLARIAVEKAGVHQLRILSLDVDPDNMRVEFNRWADEEFKPDRQVELPLNRPLYVGLDISYRVRQNFVDLDGQPVDNTRITSVTMKSSDGTVYTLEAGQDMWLPANHVMRRFEILEPTVVLYSTMSVEIHGTNVVNQAQQRFYVRPNDVWQINLLLYSARFIARDALFRFPIGSGIHLEYPDGYSQDLPFGPGSAFKVEGLARGLYRVTVLGASGMAPRTPVAMSRYQEVELLVISVLDMAVVFVLGASLALGLLFFGRPQLLARLGALPSRLAPQPLVFANFSGIRPHLIKLGRHLNLLSPEIPMPAVVHRIVEGLSPIVRAVTIGTNLVLFHVLRALVSGRLLASRGAIIPALAPSGLAPEAVRQAGAAVVYGASLLAPWPQLISHEGRWRAHRLDGYRLVAVDVVDFFQPRLRRSPTKHFLSQVGKALPAIRFGVIADIGSVDGQVVPILRALVRAPQAAQRGTTFQTAVLAQAGRQLAPDEALVGDSSFYLTRVLAAGVPRFILSATKNFTARRAALPAYAGRGRRPTRGQRVRPLPRVFRGKPLPATPPDRTDCWITQGRRLRADFWDQLVARNVSPTDVPFTCVVIYDPAYREPLSVVTNLPLTGPQLHAFYCESWPILSNCRSSPSHSLASSATLCASLPRRPDHA